MGLDLHAPEGTKVFACEAGHVVKTGVFTDPSEVKYWNRTYFILILHASGNHVNYAELGSTLVRDGDKIHEGQLIGTVGRVLDPSKIGDDSPRYIRDLKAGGKLSMLHLEVYAKEPLELLQGKPFICFKGMHKPEGLLDPEEYLMQTNK